MQLTREHLPPVGTEPMQRLKQTNKFSTPFYESQQPNGLDQ